MEEITERLPPDPLRVIPDLARRPDAAPLHNVSRGTADGSDAQMRRQLIEIKARIAAPCRWTSRDAVEPPYLAPRRWRRNVCRALMLRPPGGSPPRPQSWSAANH